MIELLIPPLRDRGSDIPLLTGHFMQHIAETFGCKIPELANDALQKLQQYSFPGNVRELENILERAMTLVEGDVICADDIQLASHVSPVTNEVKNEPTTIPSIQVSDESPATSSSMEDHLVEMEKQMILKALEETRWNKTAAAKKLGITFRVLRYRLSKLGLDKP